MRVTVRYGIGLLVLLALLGAPASAQGRGSQGSGNAAKGAPAKRAGTDVEIRIIREYYGVPARKLKPLPPGIAKNLARGKPIPPGIARTRLPDDLVILLPRRDGTRWILVGDVVLLVDVGDVIVDIVRTIF